MTARSRASLRTGHLILAALLSVLLAACSASASVAGAGFVAGDGTTGLIPAAERAPAPAAEAVRLDGDRTALRDLPGPVVNFWASWCGLYAKEVPALRNVAAAYEDRVSFIGVNVKDAPAAARRYEQGFKVPYAS